MSDLTDEERKKLLRPCGCGHTINDHGGLVNCWRCEDEGGGCTFGNFEGLLGERVAEIVAGRVAPIEALVAAARPGMSGMPKDCQSTCWDGPCTCSGDRPVLAWDIDVPALRAALTKETP